MLVTFEEAKKLWCPKAVVPGIVGNEREGFTAALTANRDGTTGEPHPAAMCLGPRCMWWRWAPPKDRTVLKGYCGAAGTPDYAP